MWPKFFNNNFCTTVCSLLPGVIDRQEFVDQLPHVGDISAHLQNGVVLFRLGEVKWINMLRSHMLLAYYAWKT